jgi:lysozyme family protein
MIATTPRFEKAVWFVLDHETAFKPRSKRGDCDYAIWVCEPDDPGGLTKFGIDQHSHLSWSLFSRT